jgi:hypothetical protein
MELPTVIRRYCGHCLSSHFFYLTREGLDGWAYVGTLGCTKVFLVPPAQTGGPQLRTEQ